VGPVRFLARNIATNYLVYAASIVSGVVLTPVIIGAIGKDAPGRSSARPWSS
jgi:hypothetical protein